MKLKLELENTLWHGDAKAGRVFSAAKFLEGLTDPVLVIRTSTQGSPNIKFIMESLPKEGKQFFQLVAKSPSVASEQGEGIAAEDAYSAERAVFKRFKETNLDPTFTFQVVQFNQEKVAALQVAKQQSYHFFYLLILGAAAFLYFFITQLLNLKTAEPISIRRRSAKGATMVEMALLISLILGVAMLATESMGTQTACSFYNTGVALGARAFGASIATDCCPASFTCWVRGADGRGDLCSCVP